MRIVVDATMLDGKPSGAATRLEALHEALVVQMASEPGALEVRYLVRPGADVLSGASCIPFEGLGTPFRRARCGSRLDALLTEQGAELFSAGALPMPHVRSVPSVLTLHDVRFMVPGAGQSWVRRIWAANLLRRNLRRATAVVAVSDSTRQAVLDRQLVAEGQVHVVPNAGTPGLERVYDIQALADFRRRVDLSSRYVLALGPAEPHKRIEDLIQVLAAVRQHEAGSDLALVLVGRTEARRAFGLARLAESLGVANAFRMTGVLPQNDLAIAMSGADALISAAHHEGFGIPAVDAQRLGVPVVAVRAGALAEVTDGAAWLSDPGDLAGLAAALLDATNPGDVREARLRAGMKAADRWSWDLSAGQLVKLWRDALSHWESPT